MAAADTLNRSRSVQFNIHLDREALMNAIGTKPKKKEVQDDVEEKEETTRRVLKRMRSGEL